MAMVRSCGPVNTVITTSPAVNFVPVAIGENNSVTIEPFSHLIITVFTGPLEDFFFFGVADF